MAHSIRPLAFALVVLSSLAHWCPGWAQGRYQPVQATSTLLQPLPRRAVVHLGSLPPAPGPTLVYTAPLPRTDPRAQAIREAKAQAEAQLAERIRTQPNPELPARKTNSTQPQIIRDFVGNTFGGTLPNDNDIAVSDDGYIVSVVNTKIDVYDTTGVRLESTSLAGFAQALGPLFFTFDPKVLFDPVNQRFILVFLNGASSSSSKIIVGFSQTSDPTGNWNVYELPGNAVNANSWTDYPSIGISQGDLFIGLNAFSNSDQFVSTYLYQVGLAEGYAGTAINSRVINNITLDGEAIFNLTPVQGGQAPTTDMYFITSNSSTANGQMVGVFRLAQPLSVNPNAQLVGLAVPVGLRYGVAPSAPQKLAGKQLNTNDCRVLGGFVQNDILHFVLNTVAHVNAGGFGTAAVYYGYITDVSFDPIGFGQYVQHPVWHFAFPDICYIGNGPGDHRAAIGFNFTALTEFPGAGVCLVDSALTVTDAVLFKIGNGGLNVTSDALERWGDYTGIARWGSRPGNAWVGACYGTSSERNATWIAQVGASSSTSTASPPAAAAVPMQVFPNPSTAAQRVTVRMPIAATDVYTFRLLDAQGRLVRVLVQDRVRAAAEVEFGFTPVDIAPGTYTLSVERGNQRVASHRVVIH